MYSFLAMRAPWGRGSPVGKARHVARNLAVSLGFQGRAGQRTPAVRACRKDGTLDGPLDISGRHEQSGGGPRVRSGLQGHGGDPFRRRGTPCSQSRRGRGGLPRSSLLLIKMQRRAKIRHGGAGKMRLS